jgi:N-acetylglucosamine malate deacetylase 2
MNVLAFLAHPDDETMLCGGTLALLASLGAQVMVLCATRGEGGELGNPPVCTREEIGKVRSQELACAVQMLGCSGLSFLNYVDPLVGPGEELYPFTQNELYLAEQLVDHIHQSSIEVLLTHGSNGEYGHPAHQLIYRAAKAAVGMLDKDVLYWYTVQAAYATHPRPRLMNEDDPAHLILDVSTVLQQKAQAALCHLTQHDLFVRRTAELVGHPVTVEETVLAEESLHRVFPELVGRLSDPFAGLLVNSGKGLEV